ncbi:MAG: ABC transporter ATP-binding protein [Candidatus Heimdallarchaeota archaeon]
MSKSKKNAIPIGNAIESENISKTYISGEVKVQALKNMNFEVKNGERLVILGPSGSGKTTLLNLLGGITSPDEKKGSLKIFGKSIHSYNQKQLTDYRRERIGFIFQFFNLFPALSALDNVIIGIDLLKKKLRSDLNSLEIASDYLEKVGLTHRIFHYPSQLSGGEQQRVAIARALAKIPFVGRNFLLLCDEPTGNLDTETSDKILDLIIKLNETEGITCILVTHNLHIAEKFATSIIHLRDGLIEN